MCTQNCNLRSVSRDLPDCPVVKNPSFHYRRLNSIPGWGTKIPHAVWYSQKKKKKSVSIRYLAHKHIYLIILFVGCCCSVTKLYPTFCSPMDCSTPAYLSFTISQNLLKLKSIESVMPSNHLILFHPFLLLLSIFPSIMVFSSEWALCIKCPKYWSFSLWVSLFKNSYLLPSPDQKNKSILNLIGILPIYS